jgi:Cd2+/Zn2+-exporting ATPase
LFSSIEKREAMTKKMKKRLGRIVAGTAVFLAALFLPIKNQNLSLLLFLAAYFVIGGDIVQNAVRNIGKGQFFDENFLMGIATVGAFFVGEYTEGVGVMLFYQIGEFFQSYAVNKSRKSISDLMDIRPDSANVKRDGEIIEVEPEEVEIGDIIVIKPGEKVPLDGKVVDGFTTLDTMALTGESMPRQAGPGEEIMSGCINISGLIEVQVSKPFGESTVAKILDLVENASSKKAEAENFITRFAKVYTPIVVFSALFLAFIPPLIFPDHSFSQWIYRALTFLLVSCPCALVISIPLSFFGGIGSAGRQGVLVKGSNYLEVLSQVKTIVFDKTGTLTKGSFRVSKIQVDREKSPSMNKEELLELAAYAESYSTHPISLSLQEEYGKKIEKGRIGKVEEQSGFGIFALIDGKEIYVGNEKLMERQKIAYKTGKEETGTVIYVAKEGQYAGYIVISDEIKLDSKKAVKDLKESGVKKTVMLTGDRTKVGKEVAELIGIDEVHAELLPGDKVEQVERLLKEIEGRGKLAFVGDGINDAPVLARADIGIAMGGIGSDAAIEAADIVIMTDEPSKIAKVMKISRKTLRIVKENIAMAIGFKVLVLILAAFGMANMWAAVLADVGVMVVAILNAVRILKVKNVKIQGNET